jgi:hypothetical protein
VVVNEKEKEKEEVAKKKKLRSCETIAIYHTFVILLGEFGSAPSAMKILTTSA